MKNILLLTLELEVMFILIGRIKINMFTSAILIFDMLMYCYACDSS